MTTTTYPFNNNPILNQLNHVLIIYLEVQLLKIHKCIFSTVPNITTFKRRAGMDKEEVEKQEEEEERDFWISCQQQQHRSYLPKHTEFREI